jgi:hypothetical protein
MHRIAACALAALALAGCGRIGPVKPPGPASEIIYPRAYPRYTDLPRPPDAQAPVAPTGPSPIERMVPGLVAR